MNLRRSVAVSVLLVSGLLVATAASLAAKGGNGGGKPPSDPPPPCTDTFPDFLYTVEAGRKTPGELRLSSSDACRTESLDISSFRAATIHMTADKSSGVIVWTEDINNQYVVWRKDFTMNYSVDPDGELELGIATQILPLVGEEPDPGDYLFYFSLDIWGDATHDSLYMAVRGSYGVNSGPDAGKSGRNALIYNLNDLTDVTTSPDVRVIYTDSYSTTGTLEAINWLDAGEPADLPDCYSVPYPQFVPTCYLADELRFNPSGTRLYLSRPISSEFASTRWIGVQRIHIARAGVKLADWVLSGPELVYTAIDNGDLVAPSGMVPRPASDVSTLPIPEYVAQFHRDGGSASEIISIMDADQCVTNFAPYAGGTLGDPPDLWFGCIDSNTFFTGYVTGRADSWQSPDTLLRSHYGRRHYDIYRTTVTGGLAGDEQLLIENARFGDTGQ